MMKTMVLTSLIALGGGAAFAGSPAPATPDPVLPVPAALPVASGSDWTGGQVGLSFGALRGEAAGNDETGAVYGAHAGYDYDFGDFVLGGEIDFQTLNDFTVSGVDVEDVTRLKLRAGVDLGRTMVYGTAGAARIDTSLGDGDGTVFGVGADYKLTESFTIGAEFLDHNFTDVGNSAVDVDAQSLSLRAGFRF